MELLNRQRWRTRIKPANAIFEYLEMDLTDGHAVPGGILGSALDDVIDQLLPYAEKSGGWYQSAARKASNA